VVTEEARGREWKILFEDHKGERPDDAEKEECIFCFQGLLSDPGMINALHG